MQPSDRCATVLLLNVNRWFSTVLLVLLALPALLATEELAAPAPEALPTKGPVSVVVIPVRQEIAKPVLYVLRRGLKEAIDRKADVVVLDMKTPGGALDVTFEIMEALGKFPGRTITFVNNEAISAGGLHLSRYR